MNNLFNLTTTQEIEICNGLERDLGSSNWCLSNIDFDENGTKLVQRHWKGYRFLSFDLSDDQLKVVHDHFQIDPDLADELTIQSMFG